MESTEAAPLVAPNNGEGNGHLQEQPSELGSAAGEMELVNIGATGAAPQVKVSQQPNDEVPEFLVGSALSVWQNSGDMDEKDPESNWGQFARGSTCCIPRVRSGKKTSGRYWEYGTKVGTGPDFWNRYEEDVKAAKAVGCNSFRFSMEWARIEPKRGEINRAAIARFHEIFDCVIAHGMQPLPTFYHFVYPAWFFRLGGFAKSENIPMFVNFCKIVFKEFHSKARLWATINEPNVQAFFGYVAGNHPPGRPLSIRTGGKVLRNLLLSHVEVYDAIKEMPGGHEAQVGIIHNYCIFEPAGTNASYFFTKYILRRVNHWYANDIVLDFFLTGRFRWETALPFCCGHVEHQGDGSKMRTKLDWLGVNYYTRALHNQLMIPTCRKGEYMTDMPYRAYPKGLYEAVADLSRLGVPMYITETGVADRDDVFRESHIRDYMAQVERCVEDGYDLRGIMYWTLTDNFEWDQGWTQHFGIYTFDPKTKERKLREGAAPIKEIFESLPKRVKALWEARRERAEGSPSSNTEQSKESAILSSPGGNN